MSGEECVKLVMNINTPSFFKTKNPPAATIDKRESNFSAISCSNEQRIVHLAGKSFRTSSKTCKLKTLSSLKALKDTSLLKDKLFTSGSSFTSDSVVFSNDSRDSGNISNISRKKTVIFNSKVQLFSTNEDSYKIIDSSKLVKPDYISKLNNKESLSENAAPGESMKLISSSFSKSLDIPTLPQKDIKFKKQDLFSTLTFDELDISSKLVNTLGKLGYSSMTLVQHLSLPVIFKGRDALVKSQTGSGKTLVYVLPIIHKLMMREPKVERSNGLYALIIVPTRELAIQTYQWLEKLCKCCVWVVPGYLIGGEKKKAEKARLRKGINILVGTPGRLMDHIDNTTSLSLGRVEYLVLDEADRMLDLGYEKGITSIITSLNKQQNSDARQTLLLSATLTSNVEKLAGISLKSPKVIDVTSETSVQDGTLIDGSLVTPQNLSQHFMLVPVKLRLVTLVAFIIEKCKISEEKKMLVFMTTQDMVDYHTSLFAHVLGRIGKTKPSPLHKGASFFPGKRANPVLTGGIDDGSDGDPDNENEGDIHFMKLHGNMTQPERTAVFKNFHEAKSGVLLCTDVASRGLDLPQVSWIVQFNPAHNATDYVHRVGRTARASKAGSAVVFVSPSESNYVSMLEQRGIKFDQIMLEKVLENLTHPSLYNQDVEKVPSGMEVAATRLQDRFESAVLSDIDLHDMAVQGYVSFIRSYAAIPRGAREYFCFKLLHLGHCAKSFALREPPTLLGAEGAKKRFKSARESSKVGTKNRRKETSDKEKPLLIQRVLSEFDSGFDD